MHTFVSRRQVKPTHEIEPVKDFLPFSFVIIISRMKYTSDESTSMKIKHKTFFNGTST